MSLLYKWNIWRELEYWLLRKYLFITIFRILCLPFAVLGLFLFAGINALQQARMPTFTIENYEWRKAKFDRSRKALCRNLRYSSRRTLCW